MKYFYKFFKNSNGFTLAEGMVTAGLLGVVSLAMLQGIKEDSKTKAYSRINDDIQAIMGAVNNSMKDTVSCSEALEGVTPVAKSATPANLVSGIYNQSGAVLRSPLEGYETVNLQAGNDVGPGFQLTTIRPVNFVKFFEIDENIAKSAAGGTRYDYGSVELELRFTKTTKLETGANIFDVIERSVLVNVSRPTAGGAINKCANLADLTALQLKQQVCGVTMKNYANVDVVVGSFNPEDGKCAGVQESIDAISAQKICVELGGVLHPVTGDCVPFATQGSVNCPYGFSGIVNGVPGCLPAP